MADVDDLPLVHVVVVDYDGGALTIDCLRSILASDWPADRLRVVLVDNASRSPVTDAVIAELPGIRVITSATNLGFAGGANLGMRERGDADFVALVNNDATVAPGWLDPLVATFADGPDIGAACPKILLAEPAVDVTITAPTHRRGRGDRRDLGVRVSGAQVDGADVWSGTRLVDGFWGFEPAPESEPGAQWTRAAATLRVPVATGATAARIELRLSSEAPTVAALSSGSCNTTATVGTTPTWVAVSTDAAPVDVINNVGSVLTADGFGADRGWLEVDRGQYDAPVDVPLWCGAAVLCSRGYLDDVGLFDEALFLYYEDVELARRGARRGWRYRTAPASVVRHVHAASSGEGSALKERFNERNRLLVAARHEPLSQSARLAFRSLLTTGSYAWRDIGAPILRGAPPRAEIVRVRLGAFGAFARALPAALRYREARPAGRASDATPTHDPA